MNIAERLADIIRRIANKQIEIYYLNESWEEVWAGNCDFILNHNGKWCFLLIFNDADDFDYIELFVFDGSYYEYDDLMKEGRNWQTIVTDEEWKKLYPKLNKALHEVRKLGNKERCTIRKSLLNRGKQYG